MAARDFEEYIQLTYTLLLLYYCFTYPLDTQSGKRFFWVHRSKLAAGPLALPERDPPTPPTQREATAMFTRDRRFTVSHLRCCVRICTFVLLKQVLLYYLKQVDLISLIFIGEHDAANWFLCVSRTSKKTDLVLSGQYLYLCPSKASFWFSLASKMLWTDFNAVLVLRKKTVFVFQRLLRQYLYFCTSKAK